MGSPSSVGSAEVLQFKVLPRGTGIGKEYENGFAICQQCKVLRRLTEMKKLIYPTREEFVCMDFSWCEGEKNAKNIR